MNPKHPIYVISKGRIENCYTARELTEMGVPFFLVVEPHEKDAYQKKMERSKNSRYAL